MSVIVPPLTNNHHHHHQSPYFSTMNNHNGHRRLHGTQPSGKTNQSPMKPTENDTDSDHVPFGVVNSMKQRLLNKVNESFLLNHNSSTITRPSLSKHSSRLSSNENLLQTKTLTSPLKRTTRLSRSQDNLSHNHSIPSHPIIAEPFTSYLQPKQDVIIVDTTTINHQHSQENGISGICEQDDDGEDDLGDGKLRPGHKTAAHRQSYTELHRDEAPKPGTVTTVKNMFERQIRLSRYDADKLLAATTPAGSRMSSQHRDVSSPARSRSMSPNDMALRQRRANISGPSVPLISTALSLPVPTSYPDLVISHTPPTDPSKVVNEPAALINSHADHLPSSHQGGIKEKKLFAPVRNIIPHEQHVPLTVIVDDSSYSPTHHQKPNLLLPSAPSATVDNQPLDFKSRLALFNRTNTQVSNESVVTTTTPTTTTPATKKPIAPTNAPLPNYLSKPSVHHSTRPPTEEKKDIQPENIPNSPLPVSMSRSVVNTAKAVTFFGGSKLNSNTKSSLPNSIPAPPVPSLTNGKTESSSMDVFRAPDIIGGNVKLTKSSMFSGARKSGRVQFIDNVDTFEYPSFEVTMAEHGSAGSDDERNHMDDDDDEPSSSSSNSSGHIDDHVQLKNLINEKLSDLTNKHEDVDDDELERLARINAKFNCSNLTDKPLKPKGTLHTFRPTHLDQYELGTQHGSLFTSKPSDNSSPTNSYSILARQKLLASSDTSLKNFTHHSSLKQQQQQQATGPSKSNFDLANNIQWSSMSTTTDLLF